MALRRQILRFLIIGCLAVLVDLTVYRSFLQWVMPFISKALAFVCGTIVSFSFNKYWTFQSKPLCRREAMRFMTLYGSTLCVNVVVNQIALWTMPGAIMLSWFIATATSTSINFVGSKLWVFVPKTD